MAETGRLQLHLIPPLATGVTPAGTRQPEGGPPPTPREGEGELVVPGQGVLVQGRQLAGRAGLALV